MRHGRNEVGERGHDRAWGVYHSMKDSSKSNGMFLRSSCELVLCVRARGRGI